jgi:hypothetical protein
MLARGAIVTFGLVSLGQDRDDEFHVKPQTAIRGRMDSDRKHPGTAGEPQLPRSLDIHRRFATAVFATGFSAAAIVWATTKTSFLGSSILFVLPLIAGLGGRWAFTTLVQARCPDPSCGDRMDFEGGPIHGTYRCRRCGRSDNFHYEVADGGGGD